MTKSKVLKKEIESMCAIPTALKLILNVKVISTLEACKVLLDSSRKKLKNWGFLHNLPKLWNECYLHPRMCSFLAVLFKLGEWRKEEIASTGDDGDHSMSLRPVSSSLLQTLPAGLAAAGLLELVGGSSFKVLKKSTSWPGTSANTLLASASRGALIDQAEKMEIY